jgi:hypothetical protein
MKWRRLVRKMVLKGLLFSQEETSTEREFHLDFSLSNTFSPVTPAFGLFSSWKMPHSTQLQSPTKVVPLSVWILISLPLSWA